MDFGSFLQSGGLGEIVGDLSRGAQLHFSGQTSFNFSSSTSATNRGPHPEFPSDEQPSGNVPAGVNALGALPKIKVTAYDITQNQNTECVICLEELIIGEPASRIPCGHIFHETCVKHWLGCSNKCPVCRYELATDDFQYEQGRLKRMAGRRPRLRQRDLAVKTPQELRRLAEHLGVNTSGCLEKNELVERISSSGQVVIVTDPREDDGAPVTAGTTQSFTAAQLSALSVRELKSELRRMGISIVGCIEKHELLQRLDLSGDFSRFEAECKAGDCRSDLSDLAGRSDVSSTAQTETSNLLVGHYPSSSCDTNAHPVAQAGAPSPLSSQHPLTSYGVAELRKLAVHLGVSLDGCLEKGEIVRRIASVLAPCPTSDSVEGMPSIAQHTDSLDLLMSSNTTASADYPGSALAAQPCRSLAATPPLSARPCSPMLLQAGGSMMRPSF